MNSFKNGFFYNCGKVFFYLLIIIIISLIFKFFKLDLKDALMIENVDAVSYGYSSADYKVKVVSCNVSGMNCTNVWSLNHDLGTRYNVGVNGLSGMGLRIFGWTTYTYQKGNTYTFKMKITQSSKTDFNIGDVKLSYAGISASKEGTSSTALPNGSYYYYFENDKNNEWDWYFYLVVEPPYDFKFLDLYLNFGTFSDTQKMGFGLNYPNGNISFYTLDVSYTEGIDSYIKQQSAMMSQKFEQTIDSINNATKKQTDAINNQTNAINNQTNTMNSNQSQTNSNLNKINDSINNDNVDDANSSASAFFNDFQNDDYGLADIITMPLEYITSISSAQCQPLSFPIPFVNQNAELPCMYSIYQQYFGSFLTIYQTITTGFIAYWIFINIFAMVRGFSNPFSDKVEVLEL